MVQNMDVTFEQVLKTKGLLPGILGYIDLMIMHILKGLTELSRLNALVITGTGVLRYSPRKIN